MKNTQKQTSRSIEQLVTELLETHAQASRPDFYAADVFITKDRDGLVTKVEIKYMSKNQAESRT